MSSYLANATTMSQKMSQSGSSIAFSAIAGCLIIYVMFHLYNIIKKTDLKTVTLLKTATKIKQNSLVKLSKGETMPTLYNGTEFSYSFWMYVNDFAQTTTPKLILFNSKTDSIVDASPIFYMDPEYVSMHVLLKTKSTSARPRASLNDLHKEKDCDYVRMNVPYVPMNRWVNVTLVVDNQYAQLFFDGELRKVVDVAEKRLIENKNWDDGVRTSDSDETCNDPKNKCCTQGILSGNLGTRLLAGKLADAQSEVLDGYLSQVRFFNYAITIDHSKVIYQTGPIHQNILTGMGIPMYGIRNPFYDISKATECDSDKTIDKTTTDDTITTT